MNTGEPQCIPIGPKQFTRAALSAASQVIHTVRVAKTDSRMLRSGAPDLLMTLPFRMVAIAVGLCIGILILLPGPVRQSQISQVIQEIAQDRGKRFGADAYNFLAYGSFVFIGFSYQRLLDLFIFDPGEEGAVISILDVEPYGGRTQQTESVGRQLLMCGIMLFYHDH
jgi:hypothetical protein